MSEIRRDDNMSRTWNTRIEQNIHFPLKSYSPWSLVSSTIGLSHEMKCEIMLSILKDLKNFTKWTIKSQKQDNLCFFRCLVVHNGCHTKNLEGDTVLLPTIPRRWVRKKEISWSQDKWTERTGKIICSQYTSVQSRANTNRQWRRRARKYSRDCR